MHRQHMLTLMHVLVSTCELRYAHQAARVRHPYGQTVMSVSLYQFQCLIYVYSKLFLFPSGRIDIFLMAQNSIIPKQNNVYGICFTQQRY